MNRGQRRPTGMRALAVVGALLLAMPVVAMLARMPWSSVPDVLGDASTRTALWLSMRTSVAATALALVIGMPVAWVLAHEDFPGKRVVRAVCVLPMVLPPVVGGVILLYVFGRRGVVGQPLDELFGWRFAFTEQAAVLAQFFVAAPFFVVVMESAFQQVDPDLVNVARVLGGRPWHVLRKVSLPLVRPSIVAGLVLTWARALGEFGATITFAGNTPGRTQTLPLAIYTALETNSDTALVLSLILVLVSTCVLVSMRARWVSGFMGGGGR